MHKRQRSVSSDYDQLLLFVHAPWHEPDPEPAQSPAPAVAWLDFKQAWSALQLKTNPRMVIFTRRADTQQVAVSAKLLRDLLGPGRETPGMRYRYSMPATRHHYPTTVDAGIIDTIAPGHYIKVEYRFDGCAGYAVFRHMAGIDQRTPARVAWHWEKGAHITL